MAPFDEVEDKDKDKDEDEDEDEGESEGDPWSAEPDEFDPDSVGPQVEIPEAPSLGDIDEGDASDEVVQTFWAVVIMANIGLLATSLGVMFVVFRSQLRLGASVFAIGVLALLFGYRRYRTYTKNNNRQT